MTQYVLLDPSQNVVTVFASPQPQNAAVVTLADRDPKWVAYLTARQQAAQCDAVDAFRDARLVTGFVDTATGNTGKTFQCDPDSRGFLTALGASAGLNLTVTPMPSYQIIASDNTVVTLTAAQLYALVQARIMPWVSATMLYARTMKNNIIAGNPPSDITQGWP